MAKIGLFQGLKQTQNIVMTQRLQQALKLLQVPTLELEQILRKELVENPLLEEIDYDDETEDATELDREVASADESEREKDPEPQNEDRDWGDSFDDGFRGITNERGYDEEDEMERPQKYIPSGQEDLTEQLHLSMPEGLKRDIGEYIIGCLGEDGMLSCGLEEVAAFFEVSEDDAEEVLKIIQSFDPPGVGARDIPECLLLQLEANELGESDEAHIVKHHFEALKNRKFADIAREMKITPKQVQEIAKSIGELDPRPGLSMGGDGARAITPDLEVVKVDEESDVYTVHLNDTNLPRLRVSKAYEGATKTNENDVKFINEKKSHAEWVIKTIEQRRRTMIKVMEAIVAEQHEFFEKGSIALRPLTLQQVATTIGMHESTVSRVTRQKYVQTPRGVFSLKFFFSAGLDSSGSEGEISAKAVKVMIQDIVSNENPSKPLSDKKIVDMLQEKNLKIARRTVAKYREQMGILSARMRKQF
ncbi:MAG: RNA polymerase factor sigma-54 [bacterium]|nr:RNA polymerase factor sigma-54 [bacterium]